MPKLTIDGNAKAAIKANIDLSKALEKVAKEGDKVEKKLNKTDRAAQRIKEAVDPHKRYNRQLQETARLASKGAISLDEAQGKASMLRKRLDGVGKSSKGVLGGIQGIAGALSVGGVLGALNRVNAAYQTWLTNTREISEETKKAQDEIIAFAALQAGGTKALAVTQASDLGTRFGISDRGQAFNTVQALQSARGGDLRAGLRGARTVFEASQLGISVEAGRELEVLGASQGQASGQAIRRAFVAGQESARDPEVLASAAPSIKFFDDKDFGFAASAVIAASVRPTNLKTFVKAAGVGLSSVGTAQGAFEKLGVGDATRGERLSKLKEQGLDTPEKLKQFGFTEIRQADAIATLVRNFDDIGRIQGKIVERARPGLFALERAKVEEEIPSSGLARRNSILESAFKDELAFGPRAIESQRVEEQQRIRGLALQRVGIETAGGFNTTDEEGRSTAVDTFLISLFSDLDKIAKISQEEKKIREELDSTNPNLLREIADSSKRTADSLQNRQPIGVRQE